MNKKHYWVNFFEILFFLVLINPQILYAQDCPFETMELSSDQVNFLNELFNDDSFIDEKKLAVALIKFGTMKDSSTAEILINLLPNTQKKAIKYFSLEDKVRNDDRNIFSNFDSIFEEKMSNLFSISVFLEAAFITENYVDVFKFYYNSSNLARSEEFIDLFSNELFNNTSVFLDSIFKINKTISSDIICRIEEMNSRERMRELKNTLSENHRKVLDSLSCF